MLLTPEVRAALRVGLVEIETAPIAVENWSHFERVVREQRMAGLVVMAHQQHALTFAEHEIEHIRALHRDAIAIAAQLEAMLIVVSETLAAAGIAMRLLKGPAVAHLDYPQPDMRAFGDIDILVQSNDFDAAVELLTGHGAVRRFSEPTPGFTARFGKGVCLDLPNGFELDVHRAFVAGPFAVAASPAPLWELPCTLRLGDIEVAALNDAGRLLGAAAHAVLGSRVPRLVPLRDVAQMLANPRLDFAALIEFARELQLTAVLARAILLTHSVLQFDNSFGAGGEWAFQYKASRRERALIRCYTAEQRSYALQARAGLRAAPWKSKVGYTRALLLPQRSYLATRDGGYLRRAGRAVTLGRSHD